MCFKLFSRNRFAAAAGPPTAAFSNKQEALPYAASSSQPCMPAVDCPGRGPVAGTRAAGYGLGRAAGRCSTKGTLSVGLSAGRPAFLPFCLPFCLSFFLHMCKP
jgi:hypothetical protein